MSRSPRRRTGLVVLAVLCVALVALGALLWSGQVTSKPATPPPPPPREAMVDVLDGPDHQQRVQIDVTLYSPANTPAPAIVIAHGFGGSKTDSDEQARELVNRGFTVLTYSARGFGHSTGKIALNDPDYEIADASQLLDWLARQPEVQRDHDDDPRVGVTGGSYGGALALMLAGHDPRVDAIAPAMTYHDLTQALLPNNAAKQPLTGLTPADAANAPNGVFKQAWAGRLFSAGGLPKPGTQPAPQSLTCGNFTDEVCAAYSDVAQNGAANPQTLGLLDRVSPKSSNAGVHVPTLLVQGEKDTLFGLDQADENARQLAAAGAKVKTLWFAGGHDADPPGPQVRAQIADWFAFHLGGVPPVPDPGTGLQFDIAGRQQRDGDVPVREMVSPTYPGVASTRTPRFDLALSGQTQPVVNPPGGSPAATTSLPGAGQVIDAAGSLGQDLPRDLPGQVATFRTDPLDSPLTISGSPRTSLAVAAAPGQPTTSDVVLFAKLYDIAPDGQRSLLGNAVSPMHVTDLPATGEPVRVAVSLPGLVHPVETGHRLELAVSTTDQAYALPKQPSVHLVALSGNAALSVPSVHAAASSAGTVPIPPLVGIGAIALLALLIWLISSVRRRFHDEVDPMLADTPLAISKLRKSYPGKKAAVSDVSMRVERGQIVGLLGPNGAGKTTTLRMLLGLLQPNKGDIRMFGHRLTPGAPVLSRVGALVEAPGFLPHLSGLDNLRYYWAATGRPMLQSHLDEVLQIAGLGKAAKRKVRTYSQGMKQRLAIAQAMLGLPELLVLDEPTNGLDPPQIHQMREILRRYASTGRSVLVSSHLLAEVEQTCTHVVVMRGGSVAAAGTVEEITRVDGEVTFRVDEPQGAAAALRTVEGLGRVEVDGEQVHVDLSGHQAAVLVAVLVDAGIAVQQVAPRRRLEDAFLQLVGEETR